MYEMDENHVMTADEIDALFAEPDTVDKEKSVMADPDDTSMDMYDLKVLLVESEKCTINNMSTGYAIKCSLWNNSSRKIRLIIRNNYVIDLKKEQHTGERVHDLTESYMNASIQGGAHVIRGDGFRDSVIGELSPGYVYGLEIEDITNHTFYDIQFELGKDCKWRYRMIEVCSKYC